MDRMSKYKLYAQMGEGLRKWAVENGGIVVITARQPKPECRYILPAEVRDSRACTRSADILIIDYADLLSL